MQKCQTANSILNMNDLEKFYLFKEKKFNLARFKATHL
jgi:hypothetical protein